MSHKKTNYFDDLGVIMKTRKFDWYASAISLTALLPNKI